MKQFSKLFICFVISTWNIHAATPEFYEESRHLLAVFKKKANKLSKTGIAKALNLIERAEGLLDNLSPEKNISPINNKPSLLTMNSDTKELKNILQSLQILLKDVDLEDTITVETESVIGTRSDFYTPDHKTQKKYFLDKDDLNKGVTEAPKTMDIPDPENQSNTDQPTDVF